MIENNIGKYALKLAKKVGIHFSSIKGVVTIIVIDLLKLKMK